MWGFWKLPWEALPTNEAEVGEEGLLSLAVVLFWNATKRRRKMLQTYIGAYVYDARTLEVEARRAGFEANLGHAARTCLERPKPNLSQTCYHGLYQELAHAHGTCRSSSLHLPYAHGITSSGGPELWRSLHGHS